MFNAAAFLPVYMYLSIKICLYPVSVSLFGLDTSLFIYFTSVPAGTEV